MIRATTNGVLKGYRRNLMSSFITLNKARDTVLTQRNFNSFGEDPAAAVQAFQLRRAWHRTDSQYTVSQNTIRKFNTAWNALDNVEEMVDTQASNSALASVLYGNNDTTGSGRNALGSQLEELAQSIVQTMNSRYGDTFVFAGADELDVPFEWAGGELYYRGINVTTGEPRVGGGAADPNNLVTLTEETNYVDIGLGIKENPNTGELIESSAFNSALHGIDFLGYGEDADGDPKNIAMIIKQMGEILSRCNPDSGKWDPNSPTDAEDYERLIGKLEAASDHLKSQYVQMDTQAAFLESNDAQLKVTATTINEQFMEIEKVDLADAITSFSWAQYCYNAALKVGNSVLSQSLMDYMG